MAAAFHQFLFYNETTFGGLVIGLFAIATLQVMSHIMTQKKARRIYYPIIIAIIGFVGAGLFYLIDPSLFNVLIDKFKTLAPSSHTMTIMEAQPLLTGLHMSNLTNHRIWSYFTTGLIMVPVAFLMITSSAMRNSKIGKWSFFSWLGIAALTVIIDQVTSMPWQMYMVEGLAIIALYVCFEKSSDKIILLLWSFVTLLALLSQTRYAYYYAINVALLSSYTLWKMPGWISSSFRLTSRSWLWLVGWTAPIIITLIIDKTTFISVPSIIYIIEGIAIIVWIAYKALSPGLKENPIADKRKARAAKKRGEAPIEQNAFRYLKPKYLAVTLSIIVIFSLTVYPNLIYGTYDHNEWSPKQSATLYLPYHPYGPNTDWYEALTWMKNNTPDPFGNDSFYYSLYKAPADGQPYAYPASAYGVMSWWDYGHWITRIAHRLPNANPFQGGIGGTASNGSIIPGASTFMTAQDEATASSIMDTLDSRYVAIDYETAWAKYHTMIVWSGKNESDFYEAWYQDSITGEISTHQTSSTGNVYMLFYPAYYQSMCARLYNFGAGAAVPNNSTWVLSYTEETDTNGGKFKKLTSAANNGNPFSTYEEAAAFINDHPGYVIVGTNPFVSPIPLESLKEYKLIHSSPSVVIQSDDTSISYVEIFEYTSYAK
jgi:asparagine N-glycosylation enzyme membrane subunit Stt3